MSAIPRERSPESLPWFLRDPYHWIARRAEAHGRPLFQARILGEPTVFMIGPDAARAFYAPGRFTRQGALPKPVLWLLQDEGSVTVLDGAPHQVRKAMFLSLMTPAGLARFDELFRAELAAAADGWEHQDEVTLDRALRPVICRTVCRWAGVPLGAEEAGRRADDLASMFDGAGALGTRRLRAWVGRRRSEAWVGGLVRDARAGRVDVPEGSAFDLMCRHRDADGTAMSDASVRVELINLIRPTVAVGRYVVFAVLALQANPSERRALEQEGPAPSVRPAASGAAESVDDRTDPVWRFVQEVRRTAPFFPVSGGRVLQPFSWQGRDFKAGERVILDLYGTNHDPQAWSEPHRFRPDRFSDWTGDPYRLVPQGAGDAATDHRCPGEWLTIAMMKTAVRLLTRSLDHSVPSQDLSLRMNRMPTVPASGLVLRDLRARTDPGGPAGGRDASASAAAEGTGSGPWSR